MSKLSKLAEIEGMDELMKVELKNVKYLARMSDETNCFEADVWVNGVKTAQFSNRGCGGPDEIHVIDKDHYQEFVAFCDSLPPEPEYNLKIDVELYVGQLFEEWQIKKQFKAACKKKTFFRKLVAPAYKQDEWDTVNKPYSLVVKAYLVNKYGDNLGEILNETIA